MLICAEVVFLCLRSTCQNDFKLIFCDFSSRKYRIAEYWIFQFGHMLHDTKLVPTVLQMHPLPEDLKKVCPLATNWIEWP